MSEETAPRDDIVRLSKSLDRVCNVSTRSLTANDIDELKRVFEPTRGKIMKTADLVDAHGEQVHFCNLPFIKLGRRKSFFGPIATVKCFEDNAILKAQLQQPGKGQVMVVDGGASTRFALLGDQIALILRDNGWAGIIINGSVRDSAEIDAMDVGVFCLSITPKKSAKDGAGKNDIDISFGGITFTPGHLVYADADGVLVSKEDFR